MDTKLTPRQRQVLRLTAMGLPLKQVAHALGISHETVRNHRSLAFDRLDVGCQADAWRKLGWLQVPAD